MKSVHAGCSPPLCRIKSSSRDWRVGDSVFLRVWNDSELKSFSRYIPAHPGVVACAMFILDREPNAISYQKQSYMSHALLSRKALALVLAFMVLLGSTGHVPALGYDSRPASQIASLTSPDFAISASPDSLTIAVGSTSASSITLTSLGGFAGDIVLSVSSFGLDSSLN